jgi:hypothetical protein
MIFELYGLMKVDCNFLLNKENWGEKILNFFPNCFFKECRKCTISAKPTLVKVGELVPLILHQKQASLAHVQMDTLVPRVKIVNILFYLEEFFKKLIMYCLFKF